MRARLPRLAGLLAGVILASGIPGSAQIRQSLPVLASLLTQVPFENPPGTIEIDLTDENGQLLAAKPTFTLETANLHQRVAAYPTQMGGSWFFNHVPSGTEYVVQVEAAGYETAQEYANLPAVRGAYTRVTIHLKPISTAAGAREEGANFLLAPRKREGSAAAAAGRGIERQG